jgi:MFS transporter, ACS family, aldohexuronate transporter
MTATRSRAAGRMRQNTVLALLFSATAINYLDRQTLSIIAPVLRRDIGLSVTGYSHIVFLFLLGYTASQAISGRIIDWFGARVGMTVFVAGWSAVSVLHVLATGVLDLEILRFLLGITEAGSWPGGVKAAGENFAPERRAFAIGVFNSGSTLGAILAPPVVVALMTTWNWRVMFVVTGLTGFVWVAAWAFFYHPPGAIESAKMMSGRAAPQRPIARLLADRAVWSLMIVRFFSDPIWWFYAFWLPDYLARDRGLTMAAIGRTAWIPFAFAGAGGWLGGVVSDSLVRRGMTAVKARKSVLVVSAFLMLSGVTVTRIRSEILALSLICVVLLGYAGWATNVLSLAPDLLPGHEVGQVTGLAGTAAGIGGMLFTLLTGWLVGHVSYGSVFLVTSGMIVCAAVAIVRLVPEKTLREV